MTTPSHQKKKIPSLQMAIMFGLLLLALTIAVMIFAGCSPRDLGSYPSDNIVEEIAEHALDYYTGIDIDLTPFSPED